MAILCLRRYKKEFFSKKNKFYLYASKISNVICCLSFYFLSNRNQLLSYKGTIKSNREKSHYYMFLCVVAAIWGISL